MLPSSRAVWTTLLARATSSSVVVTGTEWAMNVRKGRSILGEEADTTPPGRPDNLRSIGN